MKGSRKQSLHSFPIPAMVASRYGAVIYLLTSFVPSIYAATFTVTNHNDSGPGSLRQAILAANSFGGGIIRFSNVTGVISVASNLPSLTGTVSITGPGPQLLTVSGSNQSRVFAIDVGANVQLTGLTIADGKTTNNVHGAGIFNQGTLAVSNCQVLRNTAIGRFGGGIYNSGNLGLLSSTISTNEALGTSGAPGAGGAGGGGGGGGLGGGIFIADGRVNISDVTVFGNIARGGNGGTNTFTVGSNGGTGGDPNGGSGGTSESGARPGGVGGGGGGGAVYWGLVYTPRPVYVLLGRDGANGGLGGGGGGGGLGYGSGQGGRGGYGAGNGGYPGGGGGGAGLGGGIFLEQGELTFTRAIVSNNTVQGGLPGGGGGYVPATNGTGIGRDLFHFGGTLILSNSTIVAAAGLPPAIRMQTTNQIVFQPTNLSLSVTVTGTAPISVQWIKDGTNILHGTNTTLLLNNAQPSDSGIYGAMAVSAYGAITSAPISITILVRPPIPPTMQFSEGISATDLVIVSARFDADGNVYIAGSFDGPTAYFGTRVLTNLPAYNVWLARFDASGALTFAKVVANATVTTYGSLHVRDMDVDADNNVVLTGQQNSTTRFGEVAGSTNSAAYVVKCDADGNILWAKGLAQNGGGGWQIETDGSGNVYVALASVSNSFHQVYVAKYGRDGSLLWERSSLPVGNLDFRGMDVDALGNCYLAGGFSTQIAFDSLSLTNAEAANPYPGGDVFLTRYSPSGSADLLVSGGGRGAQGCWDVAVAATGAAVLVGSFRTEATFGTKTVASPDRDAYVARLNFAQGWTEAQSIGGTNSSAYWAGIDGRGNTFVGGYFAGVIRNRAGDLYDPDYGRFLIKYLPDGEIDWVLQRIDLLSVDQRGNVVGFTTVGTNRFLVKIPANTYPLMTSVLGAGTVAESPHYPFYNIGDRVTLTATADRWHTFTGWSDGITNNSRVITIGSNNTYTALFAAVAPLETLIFGGVSRAAPVGMPAAFVNGGFIITNAVTLLREARISLQSTFTNGTIFYTLDGSAPSLDSRRYTNSVTLRRSRTVRAIAYNADFTQSWEMDPIAIVVIPAYYVTDLTSGGGRVLVTPTSALHISNTVVTVRASANNGWTLLQWLGDLSGADLSNRLEMTEDRCVQAMFGTTLRFTQVGNGVINVEPSAPRYPYGTVVRLSAVPASGNYFAAWGNAASSTNNPLLFAVTNANATVSCAFGSLAAGQSALSVIINGRGRVLPSPRPNRLNSTQTITLTAVPDPDQSFLGWSGDATSTHTNLTLSMSQSRVVTANFTSRPRLAVGPCLGGWFPEGFRFSLSGDMGGHYSIETSASAEDWTPLVMVTNQFGITQFLDSGSNSAQRFYRARAVR